MSNDLRFVSGSPNEESPSGRTDPQVAKHRLAGPASGATLDDRWRREHIPVQAVLAGWLWHPREMDSSPAATDTAATTVEQRFMKRSLLCASMASQGQHACANHRDVPGTRDMPSQRDYYPGHGVMPGHGDSPVSGLLGQGHERFEGFEGLREV